MFRHKRRLLVRTVALLAVLILGLLAGGVVLAQASQDFDLGCRSELTAGGTWTDYPGAGVQLHSSVGQWNAGRTQVPGGGIIVESGYILPVGQGLAATTAAADGISPADAQVDSEVYLPALWAEKVVRFVRPCNWPWASASAALIAK